MNTLEKLRCLYLLYFFWKGYKSKAISMMKKRRNFNPYLQPPPRFQLPPRLQSQYFQQILNGFVSARLKKFVNGFEGFTRFYKSSWGCKLNVNNYEITKIEDGHLILIGLEFQQELANNRFTAKRSTVSNHHYNWTANHSQLLTLDTRHTITAC